MSILITKREKLDHNIIVSCQWGDTMPDTTSGGDKKHPTLGCFIANHWERWTKPVGGGRNSPHLPRQFAPWFCLVKKINSDETCRLLLSM